MGTNSEIDSIADFSAKDYTIGLMIGVINVGYPIYLAYFKKK